MDESLTGKLFVNSERVGDYVDILMPAKENRPEEEIRIHYLEAGVGEPMLLIHGIGQSLYTWRYIFADLSDSYRVIAIDLPGQGYSGRPNTFAYSMDEMAEAIKLFMDEKDIRSAHMIGFSTGSIYMMRLITLYPQYAANCIAIAPGDINKQMPAKIRRLKNSFTGVFTRNLFSSGDVKKCLQECLYDQTAIDSRMIEQYYFPISDGLSREALMYIVQNFDMDLVAEGMKESDHEVLLLWGREDKWHSPSSSVFFQGILQNGRYYLVRNSGHIVQEDTPEKLLQIISSYIPSAISNVYQPRKYTNIPEAPAEETEEEVMTEKESVPEETDIPEETVQTELGEE